MKKALKRITGLLAAVAIMFSGCYGISFTQSESEVFNMPSIPQIRVGGTNYKLKDKRVDGLKVDYVNLFDPNSDTDMDQGRYINDITNGVIEWNDHEQFVETGYISVTAGDSIFILILIPGSEKVAQGVKCAWFNSNKTPISLTGSNNTTGIYEVPSNAAYLRFPIQPGEVPYCFVGKALGGETLDVLTDIAKVFSSASANLLEKRLENEMCLPHQLFDKNDPDLVRGKYIDKLVNGQFVWTNSANHFETGFISFSPGSRLSIYEGTHLVNDTKVAWYDANKAPLAISSYAGNTGMYYNRSASYVRVTASISQIDNLFISVLPGKDLVPNDRKTSNFPYVLNEIEKIKSHTVDESEIDALREAIGEITPSGTHWAGKKWFAYGTSLTATSSGKYAETVASMGNLVLTNRGIGGGAIVSPNRNIYDRLLDTTDGKLAADLITIEVGANDVTVPLGSPYGYDTSTICGALNYCIKQMFAAGIRAQLVIMPSYIARYDNVAGNPPIDASFVKYEGGWTWGEFVDALKHVADANGCYFIPFHALGMNWTRGNSPYGDNYYVDNVHPTNLGAYNVAQGVWYYLRNIPLHYTAIPEE